MELEFIGMLGVTKAIDEKDLRALMETNFWAALHLTREVVVACLTTENASRNLKGVSEVQYDVRLAEHLLSLSPCQLRITT